MDRTWAGLLAGFGATAAMTVAMVAMHRRLPPEERYPLPPSEIVTRLEQMGRDTPPERSEHLGLTLAAHFAFGTAAGALYAPLAKKLPISPACSGAAYGLAVWLGSYLGWVPAFGILRPATEHPARRNALMIAAHTVWGATLGVLANRLEPGSS